MHTHTKHTRNPPAIARVGSSARRHPSGASDDARERHEANGVAGGADRAGDKSKQSQCDPRLQMPNSLARVGDPHASRAVTSYASWSSESGVYRQATVP